MVELLSAFNTCLTNMGQGASGEGLYRFLMQFNRHADREKKGNPLPNATGRVSN
jgi:hypothetical protein